MFSFKSISTGCLFALGLFLIAAGCVQPDFVKIILGWAWIIIAAAVVWSERYK